MKVHCKVCQLLVEPLRGIIVGVCGAKLLPTTILAYPVDSVFDTY